LKKNKFLQRILKSLQIQFILYFAISFIASYCIVFFVLTPKEERYRDIMPNDVEDIGADVITKLKGVKTSEYQQVLDRFSALREVHVYVVTRDDKIVLQSINSPTLNKSLYEIQETKLDFKGEQFVYSVLPFANGKDKHYVVLAKENNGIFVVQRVTTPSLLVFMFVLTIVFYYLLTRKKLSQITLLTKSMEQIASGNLGYKIPRQSNDQLGDLAEHINTMSEQLHKVMEEERKSQKMKQELITNISHDLRTPLTSIIGYLQLLKEKQYKSEEERDNYIDVTYRRATNLQALVQDVFDYTKLLNNETAIQTEEIPLHYFLEQILEEYYPILGNDVSLETNFFDKECVVLLDAKKMVRVFENLITNAVKYSGKPTKLLITTRIAESYVRISMTNNATPMSEEEVTRLFDRFYKKDTARSTEGSGLGLAIVKSIVELHSGKVSAESKDGLFTVHITIPFVRKEEME
jgi:signal transduction histidine kinase